MKLKRFEEYNSPFKRQGEKIKKQEIIKLLKDALNNIQIDKFDVSKLREALDKCHDYNIDGWIIACIVYALEFFEIPDIEKGIRYVKMAIDKLN
jgi:hypothetical protein